MTHPPIDETHDPARISWVASAEAHPEFPIQNLPMGVFSHADGRPRCGAAIGDEILDLERLAAAGLLPDAAAGALRKGSLNGWLASSADDRRALRRRLSSLLSDLAERTRVEPFLHSAAECRLHLPAAIGDYTDFFVGIHHAQNVGRQFRPENPLLPNYKHVPIAYHGRASSVRVSGVPVVRPNGQSKPAGQETPVFGPSARLDHEVELGVWIGPGSAPGEAIPIGAAERHVAGLCLLNDWSARDIQAWEYQPLGPFLAKNFHTSVSPWIVTADALAPFRIPQPPRPAGDPQPLAYLWDDGDQQSGAFAIEVDAELLTAQMRAAGAGAFPLSHAPTSLMYWTVAQMVAHHTSNGCNLNPGDLMGTGTISGPERATCGSLLEITKGGSEPIQLPNGETRSFLEDGDELIMTAHARREGRIPIGFGACRAVVTPAR